MIFFDIQYNTYDTTTGIPQTNLNVKLQNFLTKVNLCTVCKQIKQYHMIGLRIIIFPPYLFSCPNISTRTAATKFLTLRPHDVVTVTRDWENHNPPPTSNMWPLHFYLGYIFRLKMSSFTAPRGTAVIYSFWVAGIKAVYRYFSLIEPSFSGFLNNSI